VNQSAAVLGGLARGAAWSDPMAALLTSSMDQAGHARLHAVAVLGPVGAVQKGY
jgi:hypothetical protein